MWTIRRTIGLLPPKRRQFYQIRFQKRYPGAFFCDAVGVHGVGGTWGALATGLFASKAVNSAGADGLFFGNPKQLIIQAMAVLVTWVFVFVGTLIILAVVAAITGLRVNEEEEQSGLDLSQHDEKAYS